MSSGGWESKVRVSVPPVGRYSGDNARSSRLKDSIPASIERGLRCRSMYSTITTVATTTAPAR